MRPVQIAPIASNASADAKLKWCIDAISAIARASQVDDPNKAADGFSLTNQTDSRSLDCTGATLAQLRQVVGTFLSDLKQRGAKRT